MLFTASTVFANVTKIENTDYIVGEITTFTFPTTQGFAIGHSINGVGDFLEANGVVFDMTSHTLKVARTSGLNFSTTQTALTNGNITASYSSFTVTLGVVNTAIQSLINRDAWLRENAAMLADNETISGSWTFSGIVNKADITNFSANTATITSLNSNVLIRKENSTNEGGQIIFEKGPTSLLSSNVIIDINGSLLRIFDSGGSAKGAHIDLNTCVNGANSKLWHSENDGAGSGLDADKLRGYEIGALYGSIPLINSNGVTEIGRYLDFHSSNNSATVDFDMRIDVSSPTAVNFYKRDGSGANVGVGWLGVGSGQESSSIHMYDSNEGERIIHCNSNRIGFLSQAGNWGSYCNDDGSWHSDNRILSNSYMQVARSGDPMFEVHKPGQVAYAFAIDSANNVAIFNTNGAGSYNKHICSWDSNGNLRNTGYVYSDGFFFKSNQDDLCGIYSATNDRISFFSQGAERAWLTNLVFKHNGYIEANYFNAVSKRELKENIETVTYSALDLIDSVDVVSFNFKNDETKDYKVGFIADDTDKILSGKDNDKMDINNCIGVLLKAVQELREENRLLKIKLGVE
jgi:hypothetical protein